MESYSVEAVLSAVDRGFTSSIGGAEKSLSGLQSAAGKSTASIGKIAAGIGVFKAVSAAGQFVTSTISGLSGELEQGSATWKTFTGNMENLGKSKKEISDVKKELQDFATKTIYSASDMATTYSQLEAVGIKGSKELVKGFGGLAAAAEDPTQAMKTLSQQATQMAAKPKVQWQDFKLMLEQTPAGIAAVAKEMGMSTSEMVTAVQDGKIATQDFFDAITKTGTNDTFGKMATQYKNVGQAMDGLYETVTNKLQPAYDRLSEAGIKAIGKFADSLDNINWGKLLVVADGVSKKFEGWFDKLDFSKFTNGINLAIEVMDHFVNGSEMSTESINKIHDAIRGVMPFISVFASGFAAIKAAPFLEKMPDIFGGIASKGKGAADSIGSIAGKAKGLGKSFNLSSISGKFDSVFSSSLTKATTFAHDLGQTFSTLAPSTTGFFMDLESKVPSVFGKVAKSASTVSAPVNKVREAMKNFGDNMPLVSKGVSNLSSGLTSGLSTAASTGTTVLSGFMSSITSVVGIALKMIAPAAIIGVVLAGLGVAMTQFGDEINAFINEMAVKGPEVITNFADGIISQLPSLIALGAEMVTNLLNAIAANIPTILSKGTELITTLIQGVSSALPQMIPAALNVVTALLNGIISNAPKLLMAGMDLLLSLVNGIVQNLPLIMQSAQSLIMNFVTTVLTYLPQIIIIGFQILMSLVNGIMQMLPALIPVAVQAIVTLINGLVSMLPMIIQMALMLVQTLLNGLVQNLPMILQGAVQIIQALIQGLVTALPQIITMGIQIIFMLVSSIIQMLPTILTAGWEIIKSLASGILEAIPNVLKGAWDGIKSGFSNLWDTITGKSKETGDTASTNIQSATTNMQTSVDTLSASASSSMAGMSSNVSGITSGLTSDVTGQFGTMASQGGSYASSLEGSVTSATDSLSSLGSIDIAALQSNAEGSFSAMNATGSSLVEDLGANVSSSSSEASSDASKNYDQMAQGVNQAMSKINTDTTSAFNKVNATVKKATATMTSSIKSATSNMQSATRAGMSAINSAIASGMSSAVAIASSRASAIVAVFRGLQGAMHSAGVYAMSGLAGGINAGAGSAIAAANSVANQVASTINKALKIHSPSRVTEESGEYTTEGLEVGMLNRLRNLKRTAVKVASVVSDNLATGVAFDAEVALAGNYAGVNLARTLNRTSNNQATAKQPILVEVNQTVDGRQFMKSTYKYYVEEDGRRTRLAKRAKGVIQ